MSSRAFTPLEAGAISAAETAGVARRVCAHALHPEHADAGQRAPVPRGRDARLALRRAPSTCWHCLERRSR